MVPTGDPGPPRLAEAGFTATTRRSALAAPGRLSAWRWSSRPLRAGL